MSTDREQSAVSPDAERELVTELAEVVLEDAAPEELAVLPETADQYFRDPASTLAESTREEAVGFGLELALLTPYVLAVLTPVVRFLASAIEDAVGDEVRSSVVTLVRRMFRRPGPAESGAGQAPALSPGQAREVRAIAFERARALGLDQARADVLADAVVGGLIVARA